MEATQAPKRIQLSSRDEVTINDLPNELIIEIVKHMNASSLLSFSGTCKRFFSVCQSTRYYHIVINGSLPYLYKWQHVLHIFNHFSNSLNFENSHKNGLLSITRSTGSLIHKFLDCHLNPSLLKRVNVNGFYFIKPEVLEKFLIQCKNLEKLEVAEGHGWPEQDGAGFGRCWPVGINAGAQWAGHSGGGLKFGPTGVT